MKPEDIEKFMGNQVKSRRDYFDPITVRDLLHSLQSFVAKDSTILNNHVAVDIEYDEAGTYLVTSLPKLGSFDGEHFYHNEDEEDDCCEVGDTVLIR